MEQENHSASSFETKTSTETLPNENNSTKKKEPSFMQEVLGFAIVAFVIVLPIRFFIAQPFIVSGSSMETTFSTGEYLIVDQISYRLHEPERGDVVVFRYPKDPSKFFIKRIIGVPGDTVVVDGNEVTLSNADNTEGVLLNEPYVEKMTPNATLTEELGEEEYFVMGDNRDASSDSRTWGVLQRDKIIGQAFVRLFPFNALELTPGDYSIDTTISN